MTQFQKAGRHIRERRRLVKKPPRRLLAGLSTIALLSGLMAVPASADHVIPGEPTTTLNVQPEGIHGNPACADVTDPGDFLFEFKLEPVVSGTFPLAFDGLTGSVTIDVYDTAQGQAFDFEFSGDFVAATVVVKGGPNANLYDYLVDHAPGASADTFLHAPLGAGPGGSRFFGLSHISFCIAEAGAEIEIEKKAVEGTITVGDHAAFDITVTSLGPATAQGVTIDDELPNDVLDWVIESESDPGACTITDGNTLECDVGDLAPTESFTVRVQTTEPIALGSQLCNTDLDNTAFAGASNADEVEDDATIRVECGAVQIDKVAKVPGTEETQPLAGSGWTLFDNGAVVPPGEVTTGEDGLACFDGLPTHSDFTARETTTPHGYATADDTDVSTAGEADCAGGAGDPERFTVVNDPLTDISITVTAQDPGATISSIVCVDEEDEEIGNSGALADPASLDIEGLLEGTYVCTIVIDP